MKLFYYKIASSIVYSICSRFCGGHTNYSQFNLTVGFTWNQRTELSGILPFAIFLLTLFFYLYAFIKTGSSLFNLSPQQRSMLLAHWENSNFSVFKDFVKYYENLCVLGYYSYPQIPNLFNKKGNQFVV